MKRRPWNLSHFSALRQCRLLLRASSHRARFGLLAEAMAPGQSH